MNVNDKSTWKIFPPASLVYIEGFKDTNYAINS
jgi:hypothetical protein